MSDSPQGDGSWQASDGKWHPPEQAPDWPATPASTTTPSKQWRSDPWNRLALVAIAVAVWAWLSVKPPPGPNPIWLWIALFTALAYLATWGIVKKILSKMK